MRTASEPDIYILVIADSSLGIVDRMQNSKDHLRKSHEGIYFIALIAYTCIEIVRPFLIW